jgi:hypothetical protein
MHSSALCALKPRDEMGSLDRKAIYVTKLLMEHGYNNNK